MAKQAKKKSGASKKATKATAKKTAKKSAGAKKPPAKKPAKKPARGAAKSAKKGAATAKKSAAKKTAVKSAKVPSTKRAKASPPPVVENPGTAEPITHDDPNDRAQDAVDQAWDEDLAAGQADEADVADQSATG